MSDLVEEPSVAKPLHRRSSSLSKHIFPFRHLCRDRLVACFPVTQFSSPEDLSSAVFVLVRKTHRRHLHPIYIPVSSYFVPSVSSCEQRYSQLSPSFCSIFCSPGCRRRLFPSPPVNSVLWPSPPTYGHPCRIIASQSIVVLPGSRFAFHPNLPRRQSPSAPSTSSPARSSSSSFRFLPWLTWKPPRMPAHVPNGHPSPV